MVPMEMPRHGGCSHKAIVYHTRLPSGTDFEFPAQFAGNSLSVPRFESGGRRAEGGAEGAPRAASRRIAADCASALLR